MLRRFATFAAVACVAIAPVLHSTPASATCVELGIAGVCAPPGDQLNCHVLTIWCL